MQNDAEEPAPTPELAAAIAAHVTEREPKSVERFPTGARHYVYDATFADRPPIVVRIGSTSSHAEMAGAVHLSNLLRPRGAPLPAILGEDVHATFPWIALERLQGVDLGAVMERLTDAQLDMIAVNVARAQSIASETGSAGRYGYAVRPEEAPYSIWSEVLDAHLARSRRRIARAGLFDVTSVDIVQTELSAMQAEINAIQPTPFLHDTTTRNVIITNGGAFSGIVDVDDLCFGDPRYPAALTSAVLTSQGGPARYVSAWLRHAGLSDDRLFQLYVLIFLVDLMSEHGQVFNGNQPPSSPEARATLQQAFDRRVASIRS
jgi:aminoglycoside phosphotransferase